MKDNVNKDEQNNNLKILKEEYIKKDKSLDESDSSKGEVLSSMRSFIKYIIAKSLNTWSKYIDEKNNKNKDIEDLLSTSKAEAILSVDKIRSFGEKYNLSKIVDDKVDKLDFVESFMDDVQSKLVENVAIRDKYVIDIPEERFTDGIK